MAVEANLDTCLDKAYENKQLADVVAAPVSALRESVSAMPNASRTPSTSRPSETWARIGTPGRPSCSPSLTR